MPAKNIENRIAKIEQDFKDYGREKFVVFRAKNQAEFDHQCEEYLKTNPEPELFVWLVRFFENGVQSIIK